MICRRWGTGASQLPFGHHPLLHPHRRALRPTFPSFSGSTQPGAYPSV